MMLALRKQCPADSAVGRVSTFDWTRISQDLDEYGNAVLPELLTSEECEAMASLYPKDEPFRSRVIMERHGFGKGEYKYFRYPLPEIIADLRTSLYSHLQPVANRWNQLMDIDVRYPQMHSEFIERCHRAGQRRPTPLLLQYEAGDFNCLHQDLYGEHVFPIQVTILLSEPGRDFTGGEFVLTEQRPHAVSAGSCFPGKG